MKVIGYVRISSQNPEQQKLSHDEQVREIRAWARDTGHQVVGFAVDRGISGTVEHMERPGLAEALNRIESGAADGLVVRELDRLSREMMIQEGIFAELWKLRPATTMYSTKPSEAQNCTRNDPSDPARQFVREILGSTAAFVRRLTIARMRAGKNAKRRKGGFIGGQVMYGYRIEDKGLIVDEAEQAVITRIKQMYYGAEGHAGIGSQLIADILNREGIPSKRGKQWHSVTVLRIIDRVKRDAA